MGMDSFGELLRRHRRMAGMSQEALAERAGLAVRTIRDLENGRSGARPSSRIILADALGLAGADRHLFLQAANQQRRAPSAAGRSFLPYDVPDFTGRQAERDRLLEVASESGAVVISAIDGMAGVGKTALAIHVAHKLAGQYPDGQYFVDLHGFTPGRDPMDPHAALGNLLRAGGVAPERIPDELDQRAGLWRAQLAGQKALIVLDNVAAAEQVRLLLPGSPGCLTLVTSRRRLPTLDGATAVSLDVLPEDEGIELLTRLLGSERAAEDLSLLSEIIALCGGLPLAIRIAAARLHHRPQWTLEDLAARLRDGRSRLDELAVDERDVGAAFRVSYEDLPANRRHLFRLLSLIPGPDFDRFAAAAVAGLGEAAADALLEELLDNNLVQQHAANRYTLHDLIRAHARAAVIAEETEAARTTATALLLDYYGAVAAAAGQQLYPPVRDRGVKPIGCVADQPDIPDMASALDWMDAEHANLMAGQSEAASREMWDHVCHLAFWTGHYLLRRSHLEDYRCSQQLSINAARQLGDPLFAANAAAGLALARFQVAEYRAALAVLAEGEQAASDLADPHALANHHGLTAGILLQLGHTRRAAQRFQQALDSLGAVARPAMAAHIQGNYAKAQMLLGHRDRAVELAQQALATHQAVGNRRGEGAQLYFLGEIYSYFGEVKDGLRHLEAGLAVLDEAGDVATTAMVLAAYADALRKNGQLEEAIASGKQALDLAIEVRTPATEAEAHNVLGAVHRDMARHDQALYHHRQALDLAVKLEYPIEEARAADGLSRAHSATGNQLEAQRHRDRASEIYTRMEIQPPPTP